MCLTSQASVIGVIIVIMTRFCLFFLKLMDVGI